MDNQLKTFMFTAILSVTIILGLNLLGIFGTTIKHAPFLFAGAMLGFAVFSYTNAKPIYILVAALAGFVIAITLQSGAGVGTAQTPVSLFALMVGITPLISMIRERIVAKN